MSRTLNRAGSTLAFSSLDAMLEKGGIDADWSIRVINPDGTWTSSSGWIYYEIPPVALTQRTRRTSIYEPLSCTLVLAADKLPDASVLKQGYRVEVDRLIGWVQPNDWPYFTGIIDDIKERWEDREGIPTLFYDVFCLGVLKRCEGYHVDSLYFKPRVNSDFIHRARVICSEVRGSVTATGPSTSQDLPGANVTLDVNDYTVLDNNSDFSSPYTVITEYSISISTFPAKIAWTASGPAQGTTVYYKYPRIEFLGIHRFYPSSAPFFFRCPGNRDPRDLFHTEVSSYNGAGPTITPKDPIPYDSDNALLDPSGQTEYLLVTQASTGEGMIGTISSTNSSGVITLSSGITFTDGNSPVAGDLIRVASTEVFSAWEEFGKRPGSGDDRHPIQIWNDGAGETLGADLTAGATTVNVTSNSSFSIGDTILIDEEQMYVSDASADPITVVRGFNNTTATTHTAGASIYIEYQRNLFKTKPEVGIAEMAAYKHWNSATDEPYITASAILGPSVGAGDDNRVDVALKTFLTAAPSADPPGTQLFASGDVVNYATSGVSFGPTGAYLKNYVRYQQDFFGILQELKETALPAGSYLTDELDGKVKIRPYQQSAAPDHYLRGVAGIEIDREPNPYTAVAVIADDGVPVNIAPVWYKSSSGMDSDAARVIDGNTTLATSQSARSASGFFNFTVPGLSPLQGFPLITEIRIHGTAGFASVYVTQGGNNYHVPEANYLKIADNAPVVIGGDLLNRAIARIAEGSEWTLTVQLDADNTSSKSSSTLASITEIQVMIRRLNFWRAELSNNTTKLPSSYQPSDATTQFGEIFVQTDPGSSSGAGTAGERVSRLWAPTTFLKRVVPRYDSSGSFDHAHRILIVPMQGIAQFDVRTYAEDLLLEQTYVATKYRVSALLDDRIERGDTVAVPFPDGTTKLLFVDEIEDGGGPDDVMADYICTDRSATNREAA